MTTSLSWTCIGDRSVCKPHGLDTPRLRATMMMRSCSNKSEHEHFLATLQSAMRPAQRPRHQKPTPTDAPKHEDANSFAQPSTTDTATSPLPEMCNIRLPYTFARTFDNRAGKSCWSGFVCYVMRDRSEAKTAQVNENQFHGRHGSRTARQIPLTYHQQTRCNNDGANIHDQIQQTCSRMVGTNTKAKHP